MLVFCLLRRAVRRENPPRWSFNAAPSPPERQKQEEEMAWSLPFNSSDSLFTRRRRRRESRGMRLACTDDSFSSGAAPRPLNAPTDSLRWSARQRHRAGGAVARSPIDAQKTPTRFEAHIHLEGGGEARSVFAYRQRGRPRIDPGS